MAYPAPQTQTPAGADKPALQITDQDIVFQCPNCQGELVVHQEGAGLDCHCAHCGVPLVIPHKSAPVSEPVPLPALLVPVPSASPAAVRPAAAIPLPSANLPQRQFDFSTQTAEQVARRLGELKHQLKENMSQDTETRGHVNRATIELHRLQLRLKKLQDRQADIEAEIAAADHWLASPSA